MTHTLPSRPYKEFAFMGDHTIQIYKHRTQERYAFQVVDAQCTEVLELQTGFNNIEEAHLCGQYWIKGFFAGREAADQE